MSRRLTVTGYTAYNERPKSRKMSERRTPTKKFTTRAEEFCDWMTPLGYKIPKHVKAEHFDYIFQHDDTAKIARQLMRLVKPVNALSSQEVNVFEKLKEEGRILYGKQLEGAFERQKRLELDKAQKNENIIARKNAYNLHITDTKQEILRLRGYNATLEKHIEKYDEEEAVRYSKAEEEKEIEERYDKVIQMKLEDIAHFNNVLQEKLKKAHLHMLSTAELKKPKHLCEMEWMRMVDEEEKLNTLIKGMFEKYGADLLRQDLGSMDECLDVLQSELMYRTFKQHEKNLERLKHMIIYEKVREVELDVQMFAVQKVLGRMKSIVEDAKLLSQANPAIQNRMLREVQLKGDAVEKAVKREKIAIIETIKQEESNRRNTEFKGLVDQRVFAKKKQHEFMSFLVNILAHQRVRMDVIRELVRAEKSKNVQFSRMLQDYANYMIDLAEREESIRKELQGPPSIDPEHLVLLHKYRIPISVYHDPLTTYQALNAIRTRQEHEKLIADKKTEVDIARTLRKAYDRADHLGNFLRSLQTKESARNPVEETIMELESVHAQMGTGLEFHERNKHRLAQESKAKKLQQLQDIQDILTKHNSTSTRRGNHASSP